MSTDKSSRIKSFKILTVHYNVLQTDQFIITPVLSEWRNDMIRDIKYLFSLDVIIQHLYLLAQQNRDTKYSKSIEKKTDITLYKKVHYSECCSRNDMEIVLGFPFQCKTALFLVM